MKQAIGSFNTTGQDFTATSHVPQFGSLPKKRSLWDWFWGEPAVVPAEPTPFNDKAAASDPVKEPTSSYEDDGWNVVVQKPARTPLDAFKDTISEGTRLFCEQNVHPLYVEDKQTKFRVTGIKMYAPKGASQLINIIENLPIDVRNRMARLRAQNAPGAAEQLVFDDGFFGISLDIAPPVIDGQQIRLIAAWTGGSVEIKLVFTGQYITVKAVSEPVYTPPQAPVPSPRDPSSDFGATHQERGLVHPQNQPPTDADLTSTSIPPTAANADTVTTTSPNAGYTPHTAVSKPSKDTPLGLPTPTTQTGSDTPMSALAEKTIGRIHILPFGAANETVVNISASMLPFILGREHTSTGRFVNGYSVGSELDESIARLVSREHFELKQFEADEGRFYVVNHAMERNGTYFNGCAVPERFSFRAEAPKNTFVMGGAEGAGTVRITIEAV